MARDDAPNPGLGADLRSLRRARGLTLQSLADRMNRSVGWLSQVERGLSDPSLDNLTALAKELSVPLSILFGQANAEPRERGRVVRAGARRRIGDSSNLSEELLSPDLTDDFEVIHSTFAPRSASGTPKQRDTQEVGTLISGRLTLWIDDDRFELHPGDSFRIRGERYAWENPHDKPAVAIWVIAPPVY